MFGRLEPGILELSGHRILLEELGEGLIRYRRESPDGGLVEKTMPRSTVLGLYPLKPLYSPEPLFTRYIYFKFDKSILVPAGGRVNISITMPLDLGVLVASRRRGEWEFLDAVPTSRIKYALYGPPEAGIVARFVEASTMPGILESPSPLVEAVIPLRIENSFKELVEVSRLVVPARLFNLYYTKDDRVYGSELVMSVLDHSRAYVAAGRDLSKMHGAVKAPVPGIFYRAISLEMLTGPRRFMMEWGV